MATPQATASASTTRSSRATGTDLTSPNPSFTATVADPGVSFDATATSDADPGDSIAGTAWNFGDGTGQSGGETPSHQYTTNGTFTVTLIVADSHGAEAFFSHDVTIANAPPKAP